MFNGLWQQYTPRCLRIKFKVYMKTLKNYIEKKGDFKESFVTSSFDFEGGHRWEQRKRRKRLVKDKDYRSPFTNLFRIGKRIRMITFENNLVHSYRGRLLAFLFCCCLQTSSPSSSEPASSLYIGWFFFGCNLTVAPSTLQQCIRSYPLSQLQSSQDGHYRENRSLIPLNSGASDVGGAP